VPKPVSDGELERMALIDRCHLKHPFYGSRRIRDWLEDRGHRVNRKKVRRLIRTMDLTSYNRIWCTGGLKEGGVPC